MQVEEIVFRGKTKTKKNRRLSLLDDYYYQTPSSVANQNAGFALVHQLGDTNANQTDQPHFCVKILLYFSHADEASEANQHKDKRIINWQPFLHSVYCLSVLTQVSIKNDVLINLRDCKLSPKTDIVKGNFRNYLFFLNFLKPSIGTNPLAVAAPAKAGDSFQLDMATSATAFGKVCPPEVITEIESCYASLPFPLSQRGIAGRCIFLSILSCLSLWYLRLFSFVALFCFRQKCVGGRKSRCRQAGASIPQERYKISDDLFSATSLVIAYLIPTVTHKGHAAN